MLAALWLQVRKYVLLLAGALATLIGAYALGGRAAGRAAELERSRNLETSRRKRDEAVDKNAGLDDEAIRDRARERMRK